MKNKYKVVMLPTENDRESHYITKRSDGEISYKRFNEIDPWTKPQHLYFLSNEEIKEDDWKYCPNKGNGIDIGKGLPKPNYGARITRGGNACKDCRKIIASTDPSLHLPGIPQSFLRQYVAAQGKIDEVRLEITTNDTDIVLNKPFGGNTVYLQKEWFKFDANNCVIVIDEKEVWQKNGGSLAYGGGFSEEDITKLALNNKELEDAAKKSYEANKPLSAFGIFSIKEQNNRQLYKEGYINGWIAHEQKSVMETRNFILKLSAELQISGAELLKLLEKSKNNESWQSNKLK